MMLVLPIPVMPLLLVLLRGVLVSVIFFLIRVGVRRMHFYEDEGGGVDGGEGKARHPHHHQESGVGGEEVQQ